MNLMGAFIVTTVESQGGTFAQSHSTESVERDEERGRDLNVLFLCEVIHGVSERNK